MIFSRSDFVGRKCDACAISAQSENEADNAKIARATTVHYTAL
jgi:hypothetical protein